MNQNRALILAVTSCFVLAACAEKAEAPKPKAAAPAASTAKPPEAPAAAPASSGQDAKPVTLAETKAGAKKPGKVCKKGKCDIVVTVSDCKISLDVDHLGVEKGNVKDEIRWGITTKGYKFATDGIKFTDPGWEKQFYDNKNKGTSYVWWDKNDDTAAWKYTVNIVKDDGKACPPYDPTVMNGAVPEGSG